MRTRGEQTGRDAFFDFLVLPATLALGVKSVASRGNAHWGWLLATAVGASAYARNALQSAVPRPGETDYRL